MNGFLSDAIRVGANLCQQSGDFDVALAAYIQKLRDHRWWSEDELRKIEIAISQAVKPPRPIEGSNTFSKN